MLYYSHSKESFGGFAGEPWCGRTAVSAALARMERKKNADFCNFGWICSLAVFKVRGSGAAHDLGLAKLTGVVLMTVALPLAGICAFLGLGLFLLLPVGLLLLALGLLRT